MELFVVTGAFRGLGLEMLPLLMKDNRRIIVVGRRPTRLKLVSDSLVVINWNLDDPMALPIEDLHLHFTDNLTSATLILNAATIDPLGLAGTNDFKEINRAVNVNLMSQIGLVETIVRHCRDKNLKLEILLIATGASRRAIPGWSIYCSTKAALNMYLDCVKLENDNISLVKIDPGIINTDMQRKISDWTLQHDGIRPNVELLSVSAAAANVIGEFNLQRMNDVPSAKPVPQP